MREEAATGPELILSQVRRTSRTHREVEELMPGPTQLPPRVVAGSRKSPPHGPSSSNPPSFTGPATDGTAPCIGPEPYGSCTSLSLDARGPAASRTDPDDIGPPSSLALEELSSPSSGLVASTPPGPPPDLAAQIHNSAASGPETTSSPPEPSRSTLQDIQPTNNIGTRKRKYKIYYGYPNKSKVECLNKMRKSNVTGFALKKLNGPSSSPAALTPPGPPPGPTTPIHNPAAFGLEKPSSPIAPSRSTLQDIQPTNTFGTRKSTCIKSVPAGLRDYDCNSYIDQDSGIREGSPHKFRQFPNGIKREVMHLDSAANGPSREIISN
ncbi:hypothetical protein M9H77_16074 [Catharanthus roseus]|uniref:Uncharacterized protein n=1 Tax=Catharanthus roseus TaxID=4058 RepID=A0ACC0AZN5_CATRO|nr:hypothetical protein M9H77_16074 [Catharanthus roseus]